MRLPATALALATLAASCFGHSATAPQTSAIVPTVRGTVEFANHSPAADVFAWLEDDPAYPLVDLSKVGSSFATDSTGAFDFFNVPAGHFYVLAGISRNPNPSDPFNFSATDSLVAAAPVVVTAPNAPAPPLKLTLSQPGAFRGRVMDDASGKPLAALVITPGALTISSSDTTGAFLLPGVAPGTWPVLAAFFVDSVTVWGGEVMGTIVAPGDTVTVADIRVGPVAVPAGAMRATLQAALRGEEAARQRATHQPAWRGATAVPPRSAGFMSAPREKRDALLRAPESRR